MKAVHAAAAACLAASVMVSARAETEASAVTAGPAAPGKGCEKGGSAVRVPPVKGRSLKEARKMLAERGLTARLAKAAPDESALVTGANPYVDAEICSGTPVRLAIGAEPRPVRMVPVQGLLLEAARAELRKAGLRDASVQFHACGRSISALEPACGLAFEVATQWPEGGAELSPNLQAQLWLRRVDGPAANPASAISTSSCADDGADRNALAWREHRLPTLQVPPQVRAVAARVDTVLSRAGPPNGLTCEVSVLPAEVAWPQRPAPTGDTFPTAPAVVLAAGSAPMLFRMWRRRQANAAVAAGQGAGVPALPPPRVIVDVPRREDA